MTHDDLPMNDPHVATMVALTAVARERQLTDAGERPFDFADELAEILAAVNARVGGTDELFAGQPATERTELITSLIAAGTQRRPGPDRGIHEATVFRAIVAVTELARQAVAYIADDGRSPFPFADELTDALDSVATRIGGIEELFAGQPITPNMTTVAALLGSALPDTLPGHRSEPVRVLLDVDDQFDAFGLWDDYRWALQGLLIADPDENLPEEARRRAAAADQAIRADYTAQKAAYAENYISTAPQVARDLGLHVPIEVLLGPHYDPAAPAIDPLSEHVTWALTQATVVPATGQAPRDHPGRRPADLPGTRQPTGTGDHPGAKPSPPAPTQPRADSGTIPSPPTKCPSHDHRSHGLHL
ncbi:hypothetical protein [Jiangella alkaliphila]|uniref:Uncharacterized protein n=1 Tax=Jiangella alkaliphila TaxID=419479 RepID=A0A1H2H1A5_9ACTN|nr:hypothetical protein [Jiangella alkaliphila]SDU25624.1 hypothetical protein SAMN04488563_0787 [Jiangella alkaliphila]